MTDTHVALVSGGKDSAVAAREAVGDGPARLLVYLDTRTGLEENRKYCEDLADHLGVQLWTLRTHESYEDAVRKHSFPGPSRHGIMYRKLKERQLDELNAISEGRLHLWTGVRSRESDQRMAHVQEVYEARRWTWHAPIHDYTSRDVDRHIRRRDLPHNDLWDTLGRSGDCYCGCFGSREELLDLEAVGHGDHADWIRNLEDDVEAPDEKGKWAWGSLSDIERRKERVDDDQLTLCSHCNLPDPE